MDQVNFDLDEMLMIYDCVSRYSRELEDNKQDMSNSYGRCRDIRKKIEDRLKANYFPENS